VESVVSNVFYWSEALSRWNFCPCMSAKIRVLGYLNNTMEL